SGRSVISSNERANRWKTHERTWRARKEGPPISKGKVTMHPGYPTERDFVGRPPDDTLRARAPRCRRSRARRRGLRPRWHPDAPVFAVDRRAAPAGLPAALRLTVLPPAHRAVARPTSRIRRAQHQDRPQRAGPTRGAACDPRDTAAAVCDLRRPTA